MRKILFLLVFAGFTSYAQELVKEIVKPADNFSVPVEPNKMVLDQVPSKSIVAKPLEAPDWKLNSANNRYPRTLVGKSQYGLQTNSAIARRVILYDDGKVSLTFTTSPDINPWNTRGSGYNHFNGNSWFGVIENRIETFRSGWPNLTFYNDGTNKVEQIVSHYAEAGGGSGGYSINTNTGIGSTTWTEFSKDKGSGPIWARTAQSGDYLYIIGNYSDSNVIKNGIKQPFVYSRYNLKTQTWVDDKVLLPGYDNTIFKYGTADNYSIDAKGNKVRIALSQRIGHTLLWESEDYGSTWKLIFVEKFELPKPKFLGDTNYFWYSDGSVHVIIDNSNVTHVFRGVTLGFTYDPSVTDGSFRYYPTSNGIYYWNDISTPDSALVYDTFYKDTIVYRLWVDGKVANQIHFMFKPSYWQKFNTADSTVSMIPKPSIALTLYNNKNKPFQATNLTVWPTYYNITKWDTLTGNALDSVLVPPDSVIMLDSFVVEIIDKITSHYEHFLTYPNQGRIPTAAVLDRNENGRIDIEEPTWNTTIASGGRYGSTGLTTMPNAAIDDNGNLFLIYSSPVEEAISPVNGENYRDIYVTYTKDGGKTWGPAQNISDNPVMENVFGHCAKKADNYLHFYYQEDEEPGTEVQNGDPPTINYIFYLKIPVQDILNDVIGPGAGVSIKEDNRKEISLNGIYPNPVTYESVISFNIPNTSDVRVTIFDILGKKVTENQYRNLKAGQHELPVDASGLKPGTYIITLTSGNESLTSKLIVR